MKNEGRWVIVFFIFSWTEQLNAQALTLPEPVTNNAVVALQKGGHTVFYSFFGLDSTKKWSGVHSKVFRIDPVRKQSTRLGNVPDVGRLAAAATAIQNKAYVVGGYAVYESGKEKSSDQLFIFDPKTEKFMTGARLPVPIDDHVQCVWRDKLLYVISGWSESLNVSTVQVYDPTVDRWSLATPLPDESGAKVFGGCGLIAGDTIYFLGGATFSKFYPPSRNFYKGIINPNDPLRITWIGAGQYPGAFRYRSASFFAKGRMFVVGGSNETYNYNGISYAEKEPVEPNETLLVYDQRTGAFSIQKAESQVMDLRGVVMDDKEGLLSLGGMTSGQRVSDKATVLFSPSKRQD